MLLSSLQEFNALMTSLIMHNIMCWTHSVLVVLTGKMALQRGFLGCHMYCPQENSPMLI